MHDGTPAADIVKLKSVEGQAHLFTSVSLRVPIILAPLQAAHFMAAPFPYGTLLSVQLHIPRVAFHFKAVETQLH